MSQYIFKRMSPFVVVLFLFSPFQFWRFKIKQNVNFVKLHTDFNPYLTLKSHVIPSPVSLFICVTCMTCILENREANIDAGCHVINK